MGHQARARSISIIVLCACLVLGGAIAIVWGLHRPPQNASIPVPSASGTSAVVTPGSAPTATPPASANSIPAAPPTSTPPAAPVSAPVKVAIPSIQEGSSLLQLGTLADQSIAVPDQAHANQAGWYTGSPRPGQDGPSVILGHVTSDAGPAVFYRLAKVTVGDQVHVTTATGKVVTFTVYQVASYPKTSFPTSAVYGNTAGPELRVITCGGVFNSGTGHFLNNTVLYARLTS